MITVITDLFYNIFANFVFATLVFIYDRVPSVIRSFKFNRAFATRENDDIFIVLAHWTVKEASRDTVRFARTDPAGQTKEYYGPTQTIATDDFQAANKISEVISRIFKEPANYRMDYEWGGQSIGLGRQEF